MTFDLTGYDDLRELLLILGLMPVLRAYTDAGEF